jgi:uncharacterized membrane protein HdeD (DUF308 family)
MRAAGAQSLMPSADCEFKPPGIRQRVDLNRISTVSFGSVSSCGRHLNMAPNTKEACMSSPPAEPSRPGEVLERLTKRVSGFSIVLGILLIICGFLAILLPIEMSFGVVIVIAWLLMISGVVQFINAIRGRTEGSRLWTGVIAVIHFVMGLFLRLNLGIGVAALTLALIGFFVAQGVIDIVVYFRTRKSGASGWVLFEGVITLILGLMIWRHWPSGSLWVIGTLVGINMIMVGTTRLMLAMAVRRAVKVIEQTT